MVPRTNLLFTNEITEEVRLGTKYATELRWSGYLDFRGQVVPKSPFTKHFRVVDECLGKIRVFTFTGSDWREHVRRKENKTTTIPLPQANELSKNNYPLSNSTQFSTLRMGRYTDRPTNHIANSHCVTSRLSRVLGNPTTALPDAGSQLSGVSGITTAPPGVGGTTSSATLGGGWGN